MPVKILAEIQSIRNFARMVKTKQIGIVGLGWLGESLYHFLASENTNIWGTVSSVEKQKRMQKDGVTALVWNSSHQFSAALEQALELTDLLILNLPPSVFKTTSYAEGLHAFLKRLKPTCQVITTSSTGVYPKHLVDAKEDYVFEEHEKNPLLEAENVLKQALGDRLCILRLAGLIGEDRNPVFYLAKKEINHEPDKPVNLIHRKDVLRVIQRVIERSFYGEIVNVCHPDHPSRKDYYARAAKQFNLGDIKFDVSDAFYLKKEVNCSKLQTKLQYTQFEPL